MALIKCPECGKEISDKAASCPNCGCPASEWSKTEQDSKSTTQSNDSFSKPKTLNNSKDNSSEQSVPYGPYTICPECGAYNPSGIFTCQKCRHRYSADEYKVIVPVKEDVGSIFHSSHKKASSEFNGIYRYTLFGGKEKVYCPRCHSEDCSYFQVPGKTKTRYTANLNPLRPFTLVNKKETPGKEEQKIMCNKCGFVFS